MHAVDPFLNGYISGGLACGGRNSEVRIVFCCDACVRRSYDDDPPCSATSKSLDSVEPSLDEPRKLGPNDVGGEFRKSTSCASRI